MFKNDLDMQISSIDSFFDDNDVEINPVTETVNEVTNSEPEIIEQPVKKRRGRPPKNKENNNIESTPKIEKLKTSSNVISECEEENEESNLEMITEGWNPETWSLKMEDLPDEGMEFSEFGQKIRFEKIKSTSNIEETDGYISMCQIEGKHIDKWYVSKNKILSKNYNVINLSKFIDYYLKNIFNFNETAKPYIFSKNPFHILYRNEMSTDNIKIFEDEMDKVLFGLATGVSPNLLDSSRIGLNVQFINSYNGTKPFLCDFVLKFKFKDLENRKYFCNDLFSLYDMSMNVTHNGDFNKKFEYNNLIPIIEKRIKVLKECDDSKLLDDVVQCMKDPLFMRVKPYKQFLSLWNSLEGSYKNLFSLFFLVSVSFDKYFSVPQFITMKNKFAELLNK